MSDKQDTREMLDQAVRYLRIVFCGSLFVNLGQSTNMIMRGEGTGVLGAALSLQAFAFIPLWGISQGFQPAIGTNYGAKLFDRVGAFTRTFMISATVVALLFYVPIMCFPVKMLSMFITDAAIVQTGAPMLRVIFGAYISYGVLILSITFFQAIGKAGGASILALARQLVLFLPLVVILPHVAGLGVQGVFYAQLITDLVVLVLAIILMIKAFAGFKRT